MRVGILGSGLMGGKLGTLFARVGHEVVFSYARSREKLNRFARDAGGNAQAGTPKEAAQGADALLLALHWSRIHDVLNQTGDLSGKVIISCSLPLNAANTELVLGRTTSGAEALVKMIPGAVLTTCRAKCCSACSRRGATPLRRAWCIAVTNRRASVWPPRLSVTWVSMRWMLAHCGSPDIPSRSRCYSPSLRMKGMEAQNWHTGSSGSRDRMTHSALQKHPPLYHEFLTSARKCLDSDSLRLATLRQYTITAGSNQGRIVRSQGTGTNFQGISSGARG